MIVISEQKPVAFSIGMYPSFFNFMSLSTYANPKSLNGSGRPGDTGDMTSVRVKLVEPAALMSSVDAVRYHSIGCNQCPPIKSSLVREDPSPCNLSMHSITHHQGDHVGLPELSLQARIREIESMTRVRRRYKGFCHLMHLSSPLRQATCLHDFQLLMR